MAETLPIADTTPIDVADLRPCRLCKRPPAHSNNLVFYEASIVSCVVDVKAVQQLHGLETMMGNVAIARTFSPNTKVAHKIEPAARHFICMECALEKSILPIELLEADHG